MDSLLTTSIHDYASLDLHTRVTLLRHPGYAEQAAKLYSPREVFDYTHKEIYDRREVNPRGATEGKRLEIYDRREVNLTVRENKHQPRILLIDLLLANTPEARRCFESRYNWIQSAQVLDRWMQEMYAELLYYQFQSYLTEANLQSVFDCINRVGYRYGSSQTLVKLTNYYNLLHGTSLRPPAPILATEYHSRISSTVYLHDLKPGIRLNQYTAVIYSFPGVPDTAVQPDMFDRNAPVLLRDLKELPQLQASNLSPREERSDLTRCEITYGKLRRYGSTGDSS